MPVLLEEEVIEVEVAVYEHGQGIPHPVVRHRRGSFYPIEKRPRQMIKLVAKSFEERRPPRLKPTGLRFPLGDRGEPFDFAKIIDSDPGCVQVRQTAGNSLGEVDFSLLEVVALDDCIKVLKDQDSPFPLGIDSGMKASWDSCTCDIAK